MNIPQVRAIAARELYRVEDAIVEDRLDNHVCPLEALLRK
jgi:hypothetical protein